jgi:cytochrome c-type biogenesis protein CcmH/NrfG
VWPYALWISLLFAATLLALWRAPRIGWLGAWFFVTLAPASSFLPVAAEVGAERRMYLPLVGLVVLAVVAGAVAWERMFRLAAAGPARARRLSVAAALVLLTVAGALATGTVARNAEYASEDTLARTMLERWPSGFAHHAVGVQMARAGHHDEALAHLRAAVPTYPPARYQLGIELFRLGRLDEAIAELRTFVQEEPRLAETGAAHTTIGRALTARGRFADAIAEFRLALAAPTPDVTAHGRLAEILFQQQAYDEAVVEYRAFLEYMREEDRANRRADHGRGDLRQHRLYRGSRPGVGFPVGLQSPVQADVDGAFHPRGPVQCGGVGKTNCGIRTSVRRSARRPPVGLPASLHHFVVQPDRITGVRR